MRVLIFINIFFSCISFSYASSWARSYGGSEVDGVNSVSGLSDGILLAGSTKSFGSGENDCLVMYLGNQGDITWQYVYGSTANDYCTSVAKISEDRFLIAGNTKSYGSGDTDGWLLEINTQGSLLSQKTYGGSEKDYIAKVIPLTGGGILTAGNTSSFGSAQYDAWCLKLNDQGDIQWQNRYGGSGIEWIYDAIKLDSGYVLVGETTSIGQGKSDILVLRLSSDGNITWQRTFGGQEHDLARSVIEGENDSLLIAGSTFSYGSGQSDIWIIKLNSQGQVIWEKSYGGQHFDWSAKILPVSQGHFLIVGGTYSFGNGNDDLLTFEIDTDGQIIWQRTYGGTGQDYINSCVIQDNQIVLAGRTSSVGSGDKDILLLKTDSNGLIPGCRLVQSPDLTIQETSSVSDNIVFEVSPIDIISTDTASTVKTSGVIISDEFCEVQYGDLNNDKKVNIQDLAILGSYWLTYNCGFCDGADLTSDKNVEADDLNFLLNYWLEGGIE